ncbi:HD domain-containing protein [Evansella clarkii]|jgi:uncharacterized protein|uniref:HD domain-containing protein n=1 Tax=Evansella clarkii TaxID=79879 RepID=UPI000998AF9C|nr:HD domain-containing protein [Evansella clarkii]
MKKTVISNGENWVKTIFAGDSTGHDWYHTDRVRKNAVHIAQKEGGDIFICEMAALLHDAADEKFNESEASGLEKVSSWLDSQEITSEEKETVLEVIRTVSYKGGNNQDPVSIEGKIVQDADRLDALGAVGIARTFMYAGAKGDPMHLPEERPREQMTKEEYRQGRSTAVNHFYEKLLKLKDLMKTETGRELAEERHEYLKAFLHQFKEEWAGNR